MSLISEIPPDILKRFREGVVIPAHPLALNDDASLDEQSMRALTRYYVASGAGGIAVAVHTTQFAIRDSEHNLFGPVIRLVAETLSESRRGREVLKIGGVCGRTEQALGEVEAIESAGYHAALLSLGAWQSDGQGAMLAHCQAVAERIPIMGFYLQTSVGGRHLSYDFWREFVQIPNVLGIKIAPFNRYQSYDVIRAVAMAGRENDITLYTGNDDHIVLDLITPFMVRTPRGEIAIRIRGGLLGHWSVWTSKAVDLLERCHGKQGTVAESDLSEAVHVTDCNAAFFDAANGFKGCIAGIHELLHRQGLMQNTRCLSETEVLSQGQKEEIDRVCREHPDMNDDDFVRRHLRDWMGG
jgi:dihydrodipicolinate synthetase family protein